MSISNPSARKGFALPAVLAVTGVVTLIFLVAMTALASLTAEAASARSRVRFLQRAMTAEARLAYLAATEPMRNHGLSLNDVRSSLDLGQDTGPPLLTGLQVEKVWLDGRAYSVDIDGTMLVKLRDEAGMVNLAALSDQTHERLLNRLGVEPSLGRTLMARYQDYIDRDSLRQPNGAERDDYVTTVPANRRLIKPQEYLSILGAREAMSARAWRGLAPDLTANPTTAAININTASPTVLSLLFDLSEPQIEAVLRAREQAPLTSLMELDALTGRAFSQEFETVLTFPSGSFVFTLHDTQSAWIYRGRLSLTPASLEQPLWIDQIELTEAPKRAVAKISDAPRLSISPR